MLICVEEILNIIIIIIISHAVNCGLDGALSWVGGWGVWLR